MGKKRNLAAKIDSWVPEFLNYQRKMNCPIKDKFPMSINAEGPAWALNAQIVLKDGALFRYWGANGRRGRDLFSRA